MNYTYDTDYKFLTIDAATITKDDIDNILKVLNIKAQDVISLQLINTIAIEFQAFLQFHTLTYVSLPNTLQTIGASAFSTKGGNTASQLNIDIPTSIVRIGPEAFLRSNLTLRIDPLHWCSIDFSTEQTEGSWSQVLVNDAKLQDKNGQPLEKLVLGCDYISEGAFYGLHCITSVQTTASVGNSAFKSCKNLTTVVCGGSKIGEGAFEVCPALTQVTITNRLTDLGRRAFALKADDVKSSDTAESLTIYYNGTKQQCKQFFATTTSPFGSRPKATKSGSQTTERGIYNILAHNLNAPPYTGDANAIALSPLLYTAGQRTTNLNDIQCGLVIRLNEGDDVTTWDLESGLITQQKNGITSWGNFSGDPIINLQPNQSLFTDGVVQSRYWYY